MGTTGTGLISIRGGDSRPPTIGAPVTFLRGGGVAATGAGIAAPDSSVAPTLTVVPPWETDEGSKGSYG